MPLSNDNNYLEAEVYITETFSVSIKSPKMVPRVYTHGFFAIWLYVPIFRLYSQGWEIRVPVLKIEIYSKSFTGSRPVLAKPTDPGFPKWTFFIINIWSVSEKVYSKSIGPLQVVKHFQKNLKPF